MKLGNSYDTELKNGLPDERMDREGFSMHGREVLSGAGLSWVTNRADSTVAAGRCERHGRAARISRLGSPASDGARVGSRGERDGGCLTRHGVDFDPQGRGRWPKKVRMTGEGSVVSG